MNTIIQFGEVVEGYNIPVLNEREIRAASGMLFLAMLLSLMFIIFKGNFLPIKYNIIIFLSDLLIRVFINPKYSPTLILGRLIVRNQVPEYVGAAQKRFAWLIGIFIAAVMFTFLVVVNAYSPITGIGCLICLIFLFFESAFGICLGCKVYSLVYKEKAQYCPGEVCDVKAKHEIQRTSMTQVAVVVVFIAYIMATAFFFHTTFKEKPYDLFGINSSTQSR